MIPFLDSPTPEARKAVAVPPPLGFRPIIGTPRDVRVEFCDYVRMRGETSAKELGLRFEAKVQSRLVDRFAGIYCPAPRITFRDGTGFRLLIPDGLFTLSTKLCILEIKSVHCPEAWWQLEKLYRPTLKASPRYGGMKVLLLEIVKSFDPSMPFPGDFEVIDTLEGMADWDEGPIRVFVWEN